MGGLPWSLQVLCAGDTEKGRPGRVPSREPLIGGRCAVGGQLPRVWQAGEVDTAACGGGQEGRVGLCWGFTGSQRPWVWLVEA